MNDAFAPPGWYAAPGDPRDTVRFWNGREWVGDPRPVASAVGRERDWLPELEMTLASPWARIGATLIDAAIVFAPVMAVALLIGFDEAGSNLPLVLGSSLFAALYDVLFIGLRGATVGKAALGIVVVRQLDGVRPPGIETAIKRWVINMVGLVPWLFFAGLGITAASTVLLFTDERRRAIHDRIAGTYVVES